MTTASTWPADPLVHRYVTENSHAERPSTRRSHRADQRRTPGPLSRPAAGASPTGRRQAPGHRSAMVVTDWRAATSWPSVAPRAGRDKSWVLAMLAAKRRLRVAALPPQAADLTRPAPVAGTMPGRDDGTGASIEPRNNHEQASGLAVTITRRLQSFAQCWVRLNYASHTEIRIRPGRHQTPCPNRPERGAALATVKHAARRLRRRPATMLDRDCARRLADIRAGRSNGGSQPNRETSVATGENHSASLASNGAGHIVPPVRRHIRHARRRAGGGQGNPRPRALEPHFRVETAAGPRRVRVLR
jgi:hypothetical protein